jgi:hypothetical protein
VAGRSDALSSDLPDEVRQLLATPPVTEKKLLAHHNLRCWCSAANWTSRCRVPTQRS